MSKCVRSTNEYHLALRLLLIVQFPIIGKLPSCWCYISTTCIFLHYRLHILLRLLEYGTKILKMESLPDSTLPSTIVTFNRCLKACFSWWNKHWYHIQTQTKSTDTPQ